MILYNLEFAPLVQLILMKAGGQIIYSGMLGHHSSKLIEYFEVRSILPAPLEINFLVARSVNILLSVDVLFPCSSAIGCGCLPVM
jgi:hypothetical protein